MLFPEHRLRVLGFKNLCQQGGKCASESGLIRSLSSGIKTGRSLAHHVEDGSRCSFFTHKRLPGLDQARTEFLFVFETCARTVHVLTPVFKKVQR